MTQNWEDVFTAWSKPPGQTEKDRCANAESAVRNAVNASDKLHSEGVVCSHDNSAFEFLFLLDLVHRKNSKNDLQTCTNKTKINDTLC